MRAEDNPLDLNNFPDDFCSKDGKQVVEVSSAWDGGAEAKGGYRKKKGGGRMEGKVEKGKVYECRFCSLKFCKSQALGGHMNRHRQEKETETLDRARQLVFGNDALPPPPYHHQHLGAYHPGSHMSDPVLAFRSPSSALYTPPGRLFSGSSSASSSSAFLQPYLYPSPSCPPMPYPSSYQFSTAHEFSLGNQGPNRPNQYTCLRGATHRVGSSESSTNYTCIGAPVGEVGGGPYQKEGLSWGRRKEPQGHNQNHHHGHRNTSSAINRFHDGL